MAKHGRGLVIKHDQKDWRAGYEVGLEGKTQPTPKGLDGLSFQAGVIEGKADRHKKPEERKHQMRPNEKPRK